MGRNRIVGAPYQPTVVTADVTTEYAFDLYLVDQEFGTPVAITLDPNAVHGDRVKIQDAANIAAAQGITVLASPNQTILNGYGGSLLINANGGSVTLTYDQTLGGWVPTPSCSGSAGAAPGTAAYNPSWYALTNIYWDPAGTSGGNDTNSGEEGAPVLTWAEIIRRYGSFTPIMPYGQTTIVHMLSAQPAGQDPVVFEPILSGAGSYAVIGTLTVFAAAFTSGTITQPVKAAGGTPLRVAGMPSGVTAGMWVVNQTTGGASFIDSVVGGVATMGQPYNLASITTVGNLSQPVLDNTWATGNTLVVYDVPPNINLKRFVPTGGDLTSASIGSCGWVQYISIADPSGIGASMYAHTCNAGAMNILSACVVNPRLQVDEPVGRLAQAGLYACFMNGASNIVTGGHGDIFGGSFVNGVSIYAAVYMETSLLHGTCLFYGIGILLNGQYSDGNIQVYGGNVEMNGGPIWGSFSITLEPGGVWWNATASTWQSLILTSGALKFGGATSGWTVSGGTLTPNVSITPANIDANGGVFDLKTGARFCNTS